MSKVVHFEVTGRDGQKLRSFYTSLFGWKIDASNPMQYGIVSPEQGGIGGGIAQAHDGRPLVTFYVAVEDLAETLKEVADLGGKTMLEPTQVPGGPRIAMFADPDGNAIGLIKAEDA
jgi:predicted enzyme related to lactoylglutathione lyase